VGLLPPSELWDLHAQARLTLSDLACVWLHGLIPTIILGCSLGLRLVFAEFAQPIIVTAERA
jgi:hypothetical protein